MNQIEDKTFEPHTIKLENRKRMSITGVTDVDGFDEHTIVLATTYGLMTIRGDELHINKLNVEDGNLEVEGNVNSIQYSDGTSLHNRESWLSKMFK